MNLGVDPKHADQMVRGVVNLPNGTGAICASRSSRAAPRPTSHAAGADIVGRRIWLPPFKAVHRFDRCIATPDMMPLVGRLGKAWGRVADAIQRSVP